MQSTALHKFINYETCERMAPDYGFVAVELHRLKAQNAKRRPTRAITPQIAEPRTYISAQPRVHQAEVTANSGCCPPLALSSPKLPVFAVIRDVRFQG